MVPMSTHTERQHKFLVATFYSKVVFGSDDKVGWDGMVLGFVVVGWETRGYGVIPLANIPHICGATLSSEKGG